MAEQVSIRGASVAEILKANRPESSEAAPANRAPSSKIETVAPGTGVSAASTTTPVTIFDRVDRPAALTVARQNIAVINRPRDVFIIVIPTYLSSNGMPTPRYGEAVWN
jgi:hypothetical protein